jgi:hypothetical protein
MGQTLSAVFFAPRYSGVTRLARVEVQSVFSFLDWRSKLALARCSRQLLRDCDSVLAWKDSDGPSAFSPAGVIALNLARLTDEPTVERAATRSLVGRRGRVRLLYHTGSSGSSPDVPARRRLPVELFRRMAGSLPRLSGIGPLRCDSTDVEERNFLFLLATELERPLAELRVDDFHSPVLLSFTLMTRTVQTIGSPALASHLRSLALPCEYFASPECSPETVHAALAQLSQLTQLECNSRLWIELVDLQPRAALYGRLLSLSIYYIATPADSLCVSLCTGTLVQLRVLRLFGSPLQRGCLEGSVHCEPLAAIPAALPRLETFALLPRSTDVLDDALLHLFPADAAVHPSLRTLQLRLNVWEGFYLPRAVVVRTLKNCPQLFLEVQLFWTVRGSFEQKEDVRIMKAHAKQQRQWSGLPRIRVLSD